MTGAQGIGSLLLAEQLFEMYSASICNWQCHRLLNRMKKKKNRPWTFCSDEVIFSKKINIALSASVQETQYVIDLITERYWPEQPVPSS